VDPGLGSGGTAWSDATPRAATSLGVKLTAYRIGSGGDLVAVDGDWSAKLGIASDGAILVRPDGFVAWRTSHLDPKPLRLNRRWSRSLGFLGPSPELSRTAAMTAAGAVQDD
jgi:hypothetical protein